MKLILVASIHRSVSSKNLRTTAQTARTKFIDYFDLRQMTALAV
jgi:hypothetical protein